MTRAIPIYQVDAFASRVFEGNPAAVCPLEEWLDDATLQAIAGENSLSETAFLVRSDEGFEIRWFTPRVEVSLCGHATLASAYVAFERLGVDGDVVQLESPSSGSLPVSRRGDLLELDFPARPPGDLCEAFDFAAIFGTEPVQALDSQEDILIVLGTEADVRAVRPDFGRLEQWPFRGAILTGPGEDCDFVSRFFAPAVGVPEDPVTGSAHCVLAPYWAGRLGRTELTARQVSPRGGDLWCQVRGDRVGIAGRAILYMEGRVYV